MDDLKRLIQSHWNRRAPTFDAGPTHGLLSPAQSAAWRSLLHRHLHHSAARQNRSPLHILDLGCGTGFLALLAAELGHHVTGVDLAPDMLAIARQKSAAAALPAQFLEADVEHLDFPPQHFDLITARHLLWTLPHPAAALLEWHRLLRPAGELALIEGHWGDGDRKDEYDQIKSALPLYGGKPAAELSTLLRAAGFAEVRADPLMDSALWAGEATCERYLLSGIA